MARVILIDDLLARNQSVSIKSANVHHFRLQHRLYAESDRAPFPPLKETSERPNFLGIVIGEKALPQPL
jgi:hypothetical protein